LPARWNTGELHRNGPFAPLHRIHEQLGEVQERMMCIELRSEWTRFVENDVIVDPSHTATSKKLPGSLVRLLKRERVARRIHGRDRDNVLGKISHLVKRVPYR